MDKCWFRPLFSALGFALTLGGLFFSARLAARPADVPRALPQTWQPLLRQAEALGAGQLLLVLAKHPGQSRGEVFGLERRDQGWEFALPVMTASLGRKGVAAPGEKREGDGKSPSGLFPIGLAFGYDQTCPSRMPYRRMTGDDIWVDDPAAADYNLLTTRARTTAGSFEDMRRNDHLYKFGLVVEYNTRPVVKGMGSAIFIHIWSRPFRSTAGCVAFSEENLLRILGFLDPARRPMIAIHSVSPD